MRLIIAAALGLALAGCNEGDRSAVGGAGRWAAATAIPAAAPVDCVERGAIRGQAARDDRTVDFTMADGRLLRNRLPFACAGLGRERRLLYRTATDRLCSTDTIVMVEADGQPGAACGLGRFQQVVLPSQPAPIR
jgi:hypothetical protein